MMGIEKIDTQHIILIAMLLSKNDTMKYSLFLVLTNGFIMGIEEKRYIDIHYECIFFSI